MACRMLLGFDAAKLMGRSAAGCGGEGCVVTLRLEAAGEGGRQLSSRAEVKLAVDA